MKRPRSGRPRAELLSAWRALGKADPTRIPSSLLRMALAYRHQEAIHGTLKASVRRRLIQGCNDSEISASPKLKPGTVLVREWHGVTYTATVLDKGVSFDGKLYTSLSKVAGVITGSHWSGPEFFGLYAKRGPTKHD